MALERCLKVRWQQPRDWRRRRWGRERLEKHLQRGRPCSAAFWHEIAALSGLGKGNFVAPPNERDVPVSDTREDTLESQHGTWTSGARSMESGACAYHPTSPPRPLEEFRTTSKEINWNRKQRNWLELSFSIEVCVLQPQSQRLPLLSKKLEGWSFAHLISEVSEDLVHQPLTEKPMF